jgi:hypothetical protein
MSSSKSRLAAGTSGPAIITRREKWSDDLSLEDRNMLRAVVRKVHRKYFRDIPTDAQCDQFIEAQGQIAQRKMLALAAGASPETLKNILGE